MAVVNTKSTSITNADAIPIVLNSPLDTHGILRESVDTLEVAAADSDTSTYRFARVHSSWRPSQITVFNDAIAGGTVYDCGLYRTAQDGGAVVSAAAFASNVDISAGTILGTEMLFTTLNVDQIRKKFWEIAGATLDPNYWYDIVLTGDTVGTGAGTICMRTRYVAG